MGSRCPYCGGPCTFESRRASGYCTPTPYSIEQTAPARVHTHCLICGGPCAGHQVGSDSLRAMSGVPFPATVPATTDPLEASIDFVCGKFDALIAVSAWAGRLASNLRDAASEEMRIRLSVKRMAKEYRQELAAAGRFIPAGGRRG